MLQVAAAYGVPTPGKMQYVAMSRTAATQALGQALSDEQPVYLVVVSGGGTYAARRGPTDQTFTSDEIVLTLQPATLEVLDLGLPTTDLDLSTLGTPTTL